MATIDPAIFRQIQEAIQKEISKKVPTVAQTNNYLKVTINAKSRTTPLPPNAIINKKTGAFQ